MHSKTYPAQRWPLILGAFVLAALGLSWAAPSSFDADTTLQAVMSTQKVTTFYWGQDRFLNFFPFVLSWIPNIKFNLFAHMFVMGTCYFLLLESISHYAVLLAGKAQSPVYRPLLFLALSLTSVLVLGKMGLYVFAYSAQPYASSFLFLIWSSTIFIEGRDRILSWAASSIVILVAVGLNPSVLIPYAALCAFLLLFKNNWRSVPLGLLAIGAFGFWSYVGRLSGYPTNDAYSTFSLDLTAPGLMRLAQNYQLLTGCGWWFLALFALAGASAIAFRRRNRPQLFRTAAWFILLFAGAWLALFLSNKWVAYNLYYFRYFFPAFMAAILFIGVQSAEAIESVAARAPASCLAVMVITILLLIAQRPVKMHDYRGFDVYSKVAQFASENHARIIAGGYWEAWNVVLIMNSRSSAQSDGATIYGAAKRGEAVRPEMESLIHSSIEANKPIRALCIGGKLSDCAEQLAKNTGYRWQLLETSTCYETCALYEIAQESDVLGK
jgi:hypothetical protein